MPAYSLLHRVSTTIEYRSNASAPSIFGASPFGRSAVTHALADVNFHDHRPAVKMDQHPVWYLMSEHLAPEPNVRFIPHREFCLPKMAHEELPIAPEVHQSNLWILPIQSLRIGREQHVSDSCNHSLHLIKLINSTYPEGRFGSEPALDGSIILSPQHPSVTNELHVSIATSLHQSFPDSALLKQSSPSFGSQRSCSYPNRSQDHGRLQVHISKHSLSLRFHVYHPKTCTNVSLHKCQRPWFVFQDGSIATM